MATRLWAVLLGLSILFTGAVCSTAYAQERPSLGRVATNWVCTEGGAMAVLQAFTKSMAAAEEVLRGDQCKSIGRPITLSIVAVGAGPVEDFEGDDAFVVEVGTSRPVEHRFTLAWPGVNSDLGTGQGA
jgi:hypothetical protein